MTTRARRASRGLSAVEVAIILSLAGSVLAVAIPAFVRELHASKFAEPTLGLTRLGEASIAYASARATGAESFPGNAPLSPPVVPRGTLEIDPPGTWDAPTWKALDFHPVGEGVPHAFAFGYETTPGVGVIRFTAHAHGDLDGDGQTSTFEIRGHADASGAVVEPGMRVDKELE